jgi:hypothetical protein
MKPKRFTPYGKYEPTTGIGIAQLRCIGALDEYGNPIYWIGSHWVANDCYARRYTPFKAALVSLWLTITNRKSYVLRYYSDNRGTCLFI